MRIWRMLWLGAAIAGTGCAKVVPADVGFVVKWTETHYALARAERLSPPVAARASGYAAIALFEGWAAAGDSLRSLAGQLNGLDSIPKPPAGSSLDPALVALEAQTVVLRGLYRGGFASTDVAITALHDSLVGARTGAGVSRAIAGRSLDYGNAIGLAVLRWAEGDGFAGRQLADTPRSTPDAWQPTATGAQFRSQSLSAQSDVVLLDNPTGKAQSGALTGERSLSVNRPKTPAAANAPGINPTTALEPGWGALRPFVLTGSESCPAPPPLEFSSKPGSPFYQQAEEIYRLGQNLTEEQRKIAYFWADNPGESGTPAGHWMSVVAGLAWQWQLSPERTVEAYAVTAIAVADAFIGCWREKYRTDLLRPVTYIQRYLDPKWQTLLNTPPFPAYTSGHSTQSAAAAEVLTALFGEDRPYDDATHVSLGHGIKRLASFRAAAEEAGQSRFYGGIHYRMDHEGGKIQGACIGRAVLARVATRR
ncbi:MAG: phosphatase PAP2 family protein [Gemmatimonadetes bacterium]|nr:phosphatase PAP2 family protein [Gemmatimonadota bacterium]